LSIRPLFGIFPTCNGDFLKQEFKIMVLDNGAFHHAKSLDIPDNVALLFLPPYTPELNPAENMWQYIKNKVSMNVHNTLEELQKTIQQTLQEQINSEVVQSICNRIFYRTKIKCTFNV